ncbi:hypothetical protein BKA69DRAFT_1054960 [Paraphysoderma sedebokerense]|nr:hypothetical protein BKA69DRAFT_1058416 [Paraphysoderma sedebokerense]KAI9144423.1 hypothetical protein BKA69DRAFT_1054960 [Paraphysoderma sedebokerense]
MRTAHCSACTEGIVCPILQADNSENWNCSSCDLSSPSSSDFVNRIKTREESFLLPSVEDFDSADNRLMEVEQDVETSSVLEMISPLDITHHLFYNFFKESLFANSSFRLIFGQDAPLYAITYLVFACVRTMPRCKMPAGNLPSGQRLSLPSAEDVEVIASLSHSEELKHNMVWLTNMAEEQQKIKLLEWAKKLCDIFIV